MLCDDIPIEIEKKGQPQTSTCQLGIFLLMSLSIEPWKQKGGKTGVLQQDEDRVNYMESPFGQAMGWLAKAQKNPEFEKAFVLVGLKGELEWKGG